MTDDTLRSAMEPEITPEIRAEVQAEIEKLEKANATAN